MAEMKAATDTKTQSIDLTRPTVLTDLRFEGLSSTPLLTETEITVPYPQVLRA
jgi:hypothetical protein